MAANAQIQAVKADFLDPSLYDDTGLAGVPRLSRGALLVALSRAFDLAEGRKPGHAQRVAFIGIMLADELHFDAGRVEDIFFGALLHDIGMAAATAPRVDITKARATIGTGREALAALPSGGWAEVLEALTVHCDIGSKIARKLGLGEAVGYSVALHHDSWDGAGVKAGDRVGDVARVVAAADRVESLIDAEGSPLLVRRRAQGLIRDMAGNELDDELAAKMAALATRDEFWLGLYDNDMSTTMMSLSYGGLMERSDLFDFLGVLSDVVDGRNGREAGRGRRIANRARAVALVCDMTERRADLVKVAALLQDIGTLGVPAHILAKPDILTIEEMAIVQEHPIYARDIVSEVPGLGAAAWWVGCHHERIDGKGYPGMLEGDEVPVEAQVIGMCEAYDALRSDRPYRRAMEPDDAMEVMRGLGGTRFDPYLLSRFEAALSPDEA
jgi:putative nucleotidyltransferase with HDIG domain